MDTKIERLLKWSKGGKAPPLSLELSPTLRCNLNCLFCWRYGKKDINYGDEITLKKYKEIIEEAADFGVKEVRIIGGGEPLLRRDTLEIMKSIKSRGMFGYICTNGTLFTKETIETLVKINWDHIKISLHGSCAETNDHLVQEYGTFKKCVEVLSTFRDLKKDARERPYLEIGFVLVNENYKEIEAMVHLSHRLGVQALFVEPITIYTELGKKLKPDKDDYKIFEKMAIKAKEKAEKLGVETNLSNFIGSKFIEKTGEMIDLIGEDIVNKTNDFFSTACYEPWYRIGIRADGAVCPCGFFDQGTTENIKNKNLKAVWYGDYFNKRREQLLQKNLPEYCKKCCVTLVVNNKIIRHELEKFRFLSSK